MPNPGAAVTTFVGGATPSASDFNSVADNARYFKNPEEANPSVSAQSIPASTWTALTVAGGVTDYATVAAGVITLAWGGKYSISALANWAASTVGRRKLVVKWVSGGVTTWILGQDFVPSVAGPTDYPDGTTVATDDMAASHDYDLLAGDTLELYVWQSTAGALNCSGTLSALYLND